MFVRFTSDVCYAYTCRWAIGLLNNNQFSDSVFTRNKIIAYLQIHLAERIVLDQRGSCFLVLRAVYIHLSRVYGHPEFSQTMNFAIYQISKADYPNYYSPEQNPY